MTDTGPTESPEGTTTSVLEYLRAEARAHPESAALRQRLAAEEAQLAEGRREAEQRSRQAQAADLEAQLAPIKQALRAAHADASDEEYERLWRKELRPKFAGDAALRA